MRKLARGCEARGQKWVQSVSVTGAALFTLQSRAARRFAESRPRAVRFFAALQLRSFPQRSRASLSVVGQRA